mgnify:CR=1 FL=1
MLWVIKTKAVEGHALAIASVAKTNEKVPVESKEAEREGDDLDWLDIPAELKEKFRELWNNLTDEQKEEMKEKWSQMSQEEKDQMIEVWSQQL